jgi:uncharacterized protein (DUF169 family)
MIDELKHIFGPKCTAISVNGELTEFVNIPSKQMKFCESVNYSFNIPVKIINENLGCHGARRCIGFDHSDTQLSKSISEKNKIPVRFIRSALYNIPKLICIKHIVLGMTEYMEKELQPDLYIIYMKPVWVAAMMHYLAKINIIPSIPPYSLLSVCGNVFSNCYKNHVACISFGCPESREHGGIEKSEVVMGIPYQTAVEVIRDFLYKSLWTNHCPTC